METENRQGSAEVRRGFGRDPFGGSNNMWDLPFSRSGTFVVHRMSKIQLKYSVRVRLNVEGYC